MRNVTKLFGELERLVGNTPMAEISYEFEGRPAKLYAKLEYYNFSGSIKDRMALNCLKMAYRNGDLEPGFTIAETTSGNTGIAFAAMASFLGHKAVVFMPDWMSDERKRLIASFGAELKLVSREDGGFLGCLEKTNEFAKNGGVYLPCQFANMYNMEAHYMSTGPEILRQMDKLGAKPCAFVAGVGTGGTVMGVGRYLRGVHKNVKMFPMEPLSSPTLSTGYRVGKHRIAGIGDEFIPDIINLSECDKVIQVDDGDSIVMAQRLAKELGLGLGISSGANFLAAVVAAGMEVEGGSVATVFSDDNKKYLSTDYAKEEPVKDGFLSPKITLLGIRTCV